MKMTSSHIITTFFNTDHVQVCNFVFFHFRSNEWLCYVFIQVSRGGRLCSAYVWSFSVNFLIASVSHLDITYTVAWSLFTCKDELILDTGFLLILHLYTSAIMLISLISLQWVWSTVPSNWTGVNSGSLPNTVFVPFFQMSSLYVLCVRRLEVLPDEALSDFTSSTLCPWPLCTFDL